MTADDFRRIALSFPGAVESAHMNHPDFRVGKKIFATLGYPDDDWAMVKLTPEQQQNFLDAAPEVFSPVPGGWGRGGATRVCLKSAKKPLTRKALETAWQAHQPQKKKAP